MQFSSGSFDISAHDLYSGHSLSLIYSNKALVMLAMRDTSRQSSVWTLFCSYVYTYIHNYWNAGAESQIRFFLVLCTSIEVSVVFVDVVVQSVDTLHVQHCWSIWNVYEFNFSTKYHILFSFCINDIFLFFSWILFLSFPFMNASRNMTLYPSNKLSIFMINEISFTYTAIDFK